MSDDDRLADYLARMDNPDHVRTLTDGCGGCGHSAVFCRCVTYIEGSNTRCCVGCSH